MTELTMSPLWKARLLDLIRIVSIILSFYTMMLVITGDPVKYDIPLIVTIFMVTNIVLVILLGEHLRTLDPNIMALEKEYREIKARG